MYETLMRLGSAVTYAPTLAAGYSWTSGIDTGILAMRDRPLAFSAELGQGIATSDTGAAVSATWSVVCGISNSSGGTYTPIAHDPGGTSVLISNGTSRGTELTDSVVVPIFLTGSSTALHGGPFVRVGFRATNGGSTGMSLVSARLTTI